MILKLNRRYTFSTVAPTMLGAEYKNVKVKALLDSNEAIKHRDITTLHNNMKAIVPTLPQLNDCTFVLFETTNNEKLLLALEYIDIYSIVEVATTNIRVDIPNSDSDTISLIRNRLLELGITNFNIYTY